VEERRDGPITELRWPLLTSSFLQRTRFAQVPWRANQLSLAALLRRYQVEVVISSNNYLFSMDPRWNGKYVFDLPDDPVGDLTRRHEQVAHQVVSRECRKADLVTAVSRSLADKLRQNYSVQARCLPNGTDRADFENCDQRRVAAIKDRHGLWNKYVVGFIGNHEGHAGIDFMLDVTRELRRVAPDAVLLIVGPVVPPLRDSQDGVIPVGPVPPSEIAPYFKAIDVGVLPFVQNSFTDNALPIKVIEYAASGKVVVATPLRELQMLNLPGVFLTERSVGPWVEALLSARQLSWDRRWSERFREYDWRGIADRLMEMVRDTS
jgi:glycosyltransferase involved in cell wall biosynthesis